MDSIVIKFQGKELDTKNLANNSHPDYEIVKSYQIIESSRGDTDELKVNLAPNTIIEFLYEDDTIWLADDQTIRELPHLTELHRGGNEIEIPSFIATSDDSRGIVKKLALKVINFFVKKGVNAIEERIESRILELAKDFDNKRLNNQSGLFELDRSFILSSPKSLNQPQKYLLFIHGTASNTQGSFGELKGTSTWDFIHQTYPERVLAFQHETISKSPLQNAVELAEALPSNITIDLITSSRGGLIGEILSLYSKISSRGLEQYIALLKKEDRTPDITSITKLNEIFSKKAIKIDRFVRAGCPASGTSLASQRLSDFLNVILNLVGLATGGKGNPIFDAFKTIVLEAIRTKDNADALPGLEAQRIESPFIKILNDPSENAGIVDNLVVLSSNSKPEFNLKGLLIITSKLLFQRRNDLVVDTDSMYRGVKRNNEIRYHFEESSDIDHFKYFKNPETRKKLELALNESLDNSHFKVFNQNQIPETDRNAAFTTLGAEGGELFSKTPKGNKPIIVLLPGIMGSVLQDGQKTRWINYLGIIGGELTSLALDNENISAPAIIKSSYNKFFEKFSETHDVVIFPYDWRKSLDKSTSDFKNKIEELFELKQPIQIVAHSMGGVLVRDFILQFPETWKKLNNSSGFRTIFLGTPFKGSYRIPAVLMGRDSIIRTLGKLDFVNSRKDLLKMFSRFGGIHNLLPLSDTDSEDFANMENWIMMKNALDEGEDFPLPTQEDLAVFKAYRDKVNKEQENIDFSNLIYVAGKADETTSAYKINKFSNGKTELVFYATPEGDQSVTWDTIPKKFDNRLYYVNVSHGALANDSSLFEGIQELLQKGFTNLFQRNPIQDRSSVKEFIQSVPPVYDLSRAGVEGALLGLGMENKVVVEQMKLNVSVGLGDLKYSSYPILVGHFKGDGIYQAEKVVDILLDNILSIRQQVGLYPEEIGTSEIFDTDNDNGELKFNGAIIVGLGTVGELTSFMLTTTIKQATIKYLLKKILHFNIKKDNQTLGISTLLIGSGYGGLGIEKSIRSIIEGVKLANESVKGVFKGNTLAIEKIEFIELYEDKAQNTQELLLQIAKDDSSTLQISVAPHINELLGWRKQTINNVDRDWWNFMTAIQTKRGEIEGISYNFSAGGAKIDSRELFVGSSVVSDITNSISKKNDWSGEVSKALFNLMIPNEFKDFFRQKRNIIWNLDKNTAAFPWELLQESLEKGEVPLSIGSQMIRKLQTTNSVVNPTYFSGDTALIIADPNIAGNEKYRQLPGAEKEGKQVDEIFTKNLIKTTSLFKKNSTQNLTKLLFGGYRFLHLAGHGAFDPKDPTKTGMLIGKDAFFTMAHVKQMEILPEFVFVNCCQLGEMDAESDIITQNDLQLASNIGTQLIEIGVKAVIVAGWNIKDAAATKFTEVFYEKMFDGNTFGDAVLAARKKIYEESGHQNNTWGAYQCYGDQFFRFKIKNAYYEDTRPYGISKKAEIDLFNLLNSLETGKGTPQTIKEKLDSIIKKIDDEGLRNTEINQLEALIYAELGEYGSASHLLRKIIENENSRFPSNLIEKYCNILTKYAVVEKINNNFVDISGAFLKLNSLISIYSSAERLNLLGSAYKRKAYLETNEKDKLNAYFLSFYYYHLANEKLRGKAKIYPIANCIALGKLLQNHISGLSNLEQNDIDIAILKTKIQEINANAANEITELRKKLNENKITTDYWESVYKANLDFCDYIIDKNKNKTVDELTKTYHIVWKHAGSRAKKLSEIESLEIFVDFLQLNDRVPKKATKPNPTIELLKELIENLRKLL